VTTTPKNSENEVLIRSAQSLNKERRIIKKVREKLNEIKSEVRAE
jgi:hypothetical protein